MQGKKAYLQAGAGIVADSDPASEYQESLNKAQAVIRAVESARNGNT
jgi:anthranilate synthase component I